MVKLVGGVAVVRLFGAPKIKPPGPELGDKKWTTWLRFSQRRQLSIRVGVKIGSLQDIVFGKNALKSNKIKNKNKNV